MTLHPGINTTKVAGSGLEGLPGLLIAIAFVLIFAGIFVPRESGNRFLLVFLSIEAAAAILYILSKRRNARESEQLKKEMHQINK